MYVKQVKAEFASSHRDQDGSTRLCIILINLCVKELEMVLLLSLSGE